MIELTPLARPYAKALFSSAVESNTIDEMALELKTMAMSSMTEEVINTIENPVLSRQEVVNILLKLFEESVSNASKKLIEVLAENKRLNLLETIYETYQELLEAHKEQKSVEVFVAVEPGEEAKDNIEQKLKLTYGKDANIFFSKDPTMMGGLSIKIGDETLDLSIKGKVKKLVNQLNF
ncbi:MAG: ATP synthase F1 subunit delta [Gammaproteobacteria bacterium]|nr:ATP synthase F1 subunit delta [Gammaproteobacteria bacterium]|tara:strand:- start:123 stop:659 length:537 start_codon:yes stop_codon:yes gene_type:complete